MNKDKVIKDLKERNDSLNNQYRLRDIRCVYLENEVQEQKKEIERLQKIIFSAMHYIDQVLGYHLSSGYEQLDKDCNELFGILKGVDKE